MSKKGIKKGACLIHGKLTPEISVISKENYGERLRCKLCRNERANIQNINKKIRGLCEKHGFPKNKDNNYTCKKCRNNYQRKKYNEDLELAREKVRKKRSKNIKRYRENVILNQKGITREEYYKMFDDQKSLCAICNQPETRIGRTGQVSTLCVDHCHRTLKIRGLLCHDCNTGIGKFQDNIQLLERAIEYLKKHDS